MGARKGKRLQIELPVSVSGFDKNGNPFVQKAKTVDISWCGIRLAGIRCLLGPGDIVRVQYKDKRGRYRVVWMEEETATLGLEGVEGARLLFADHLPPTAGILTEVDTYSPPPAVEPAASPAHGGERRTSDRREGERRRYKRYNCAGMAHVRESNSQFASDGRVLDISLCGCYVEMISPMRVSTPVHLDMNLSGHVLSLPAMVRVSQLSMGMGVEFTDVPPGEMEKLCQVIAALGGDLGGVAGTATSTPAGSAGAVQVGSAVLRWFATHDQLSREEFQELLRASNKPS